MDELIDCHAERSQLENEKQILYINAYMEFRNIIQLILLGKHK